MPVAKVETTAGKSASDFSVAQGALPGAARRTEPGICRQGCEMSKISNSGESKNTLYCSFCGKSQHEVRKLIAGPTVFICDECVELCMDNHPRGKQILDGEVGRRHSHAARDPRSAQRLRDRPEACQARAICCRPQQPFTSASHTHRRTTMSSWRSSNIMLIGTTGCGKNAACPDAGPHPGCSIHHGRCHDADRSGLCRRGRREHHPEAPAGGDYNVERAQRGIVYIDESTRSRGSRTTRRSPATCRARACNRRF